MTTAYPVILKILIVVLVYKAPFRSSELQQDESRKRAIFLEPRHFNPHPYEKTLVNPTTGPVLFPPAPQSSDSVAASNRIIVIPNGVADADNPYPRVSTKNQLIIPSRYQPQVPNPAIYVALANHGSRVLAEPRVHFVHDESLSDQKKQYEFAYKVVDRLHGDDFSHRQSQNAKATNGEYRVKLPDGRTQIVSYTADSSGYKADVKYDLNAHTVTAVAVEPPPPPVPTILSNYLEAQPSPASLPVSHQHQVLADEQLSHYNQQQQYVVEATLATPRFFYQLPQRRLHAYPKTAREYAAQAVVGPGPSQQPYHSHHDHHHHLQQQQQQQEFQEQISPSAGPYHLQDIVVPVLSEKGAATPDGYSEVYINTPRFTFTQNHHHDAVYG